MAIFLEAIMRLSPLIAAFVSRQGTSFLSRESFHTTSSLQAMKYVLQYKYVPDVLEKRGPFREEHLQLAQTCEAGGPYTEMGQEIPGGAFFIFATEALAKEFSEKDPYVTNGIVTEHSIVEWNVVVEN